MRILSLLLAALMLLSLAACVKNPDPAETTDPAEATAATDPAETDDPALRDNLPAETFNGEEILIWLGHNEYSASFNPDPDSKGDVVAEATNQRNSAVEERFDVTIKWITGENGEASSARYTAMQSSILAGDRLDLVNHISTSLTPRMLAGCFINMANNEILDYDKAWYFDYVMDNLRINDRLYGTASWFDFNTIDRCSIVFFNMDMAKNYNVGDLYGMVYDGTWTYDKMMEICEAVGNDVNNDGVYDDNDVYGMAGEQDSWFQQVYTTGYTFVTQKEDGSLVVSEMDDRLIGAFETVRKIFKSNWYQSYYTYGEERRPAVEMYENFNNDRILFIMKKLGSTSAELLRDGGKFGLLPTPKFTEDMEYGSATLPAITCMPVTVGNARTSSIILEAMAAEAYKIMRPAYFDIALSYKYVNDASSREMLDIALSNLYCDFGYMYMDCGFGRQIPMTLTQAENLSSWMAIHTPSTNAGLAALVEKITNLPA